MLVVLCPCAGTDPEPCMLQVQVFGDVDFKGNFLTSELFSRLDLDVLRVRGSKLLVPSKNLDLIQGVREEAVAAGMSGFTYPTIEGVSTMADVLPIAFSTQHAVWKATTSDSSRGPQQ